MYLVFSLLIGSIMFLMLLKVARSVQEAYAARAGYITFGGDDKYQHANFDKNIHDAIMIARVKLNHMPDDIFTSTVQRLKENYKLWYNNLHSSIHKKMAAGGFCTPIEEWDEYEHYKPGDKALLTKVIICKKDKVVILIGNHAFLGGYLLSHFVQLLFCKNYYNGIFPKNRYLPILTESHILLLLARTVFSKKYQPATVFSDPNIIKRYYMKTNLADLKALAQGKRIHHMYLAIAKHVLQTMDCLNRNEIKVSLPVSFEDLTTFNTVGTVILDLQRESDICQLAVKIKRLMRFKQYNAAVTNHIQRIFPTRHLSSRVRNMVDLTLTLVPQKTLPDNLIGEQMSDYEFTMQSITYPVYIMAFIFEGHIHSSYMINSPEYDQSKLLNSGDNVQEIDFVI